MLFFPSGSSILSVAVAKGTDFGSHFRNHFSTRSVKRVVYVPFEKHAVAAVLVVFWTQDAHLGVQDG